MGLREKLVSESMRIVTSPPVAKLMQDERFMRLVMAAIAVPGRVQTFTEEQKEQFARALGLATVDEVRDLRRAVASLEDAVSRLESAQRK